MKEDEPQRIAAVTLDGRDIAWRHEQGDVVFEAALPAGGAGRPTSPKRS